MARRMLPFLIAAALLAPVIARADDSCSNPCPEGQVTNSFLDGQQVTCTCMDPGPGMTDDTDVQYGGTGDETPANTEG